MSYQVATQEILKQNNATQDRSMPASAQAAWQPEPSFFGKLGTKGRVQLLQGAEWLAPIMALHHRVRTDMPEAEKKFLLARPADYFRPLLQGEGGCALGAIVGGKLVGMVAVRTADHFTAAQAKTLVTYPDADGAVAALCKEQKVAVLQSLCLHGNWTGQGYSRALIEAALLWCDRQGIGQIFAQTAEANSLCWLKFLQQDFAILGQWTNGHSRYLLKRLTPREKMKKLLEALPQDRILLNKDYSVLATAIAQLSQRLKAGGMLVLDQRAGGAVDQWQLVFEGF